MIGKRLKKNWIKALRSGEYKQGKGNLRYVNSSGVATYCCLGVLRRISKGTVRKDHGGDEVLATSCGIDRETQNILACMNDGFKSDKKSFIEIADWIERSKEI